MVRLVKPGLPTPSRWLTTTYIEPQQQGDFADVESVTVVTRQASGEEIGRLSDVDVRPGQREIPNAFSAAHLRKLPPTRVLVTVTAQIGSSERTIAEHTLEHTGAFDRLPAAP